MTRGEGSVKKVTSLIPKISFAAFHLFAVRKSVKYIISFDFMLLQLFLMKIKKKVSGQIIALERLFPSIVKNRVCHFLVGDMGGGGRDK